MRPQSRIVVGLVSALVAGSSAASTAPALARHRVHKPHARAVENVPAGPRGGQPADGPLPGPRGLYAGAGGIFSPNYEVPGGPVYHVGAQLLGGEFGKAYEDYYKHYYYYKYAYCPVGTSYVIYLRRCVGPFDLFR